MTPSERAGPGDADDAATDTEADALEDEGDLGEADDAPMPDEPGPRLSPQEDIVVIEDDDDFVVVESPEEAKVRRRQEKAEKEKAAQPRPRMNFWMILLIFGVLFIMINPALRAITATAVGTALEPVIGFDGRFPTLSIILTGVTMIVLTTVVRHFFIDWLHLAKVQNTMRAFQKEFGAARKEKNTKRMNELQKDQPRVMGLQAEVTGSQMKPMAVSMLVVVPLFAWLWVFVTRFDYHFFSTPWNLHVDFFTREGIIFGSSILPHWILLYSIMSIPFGQVLQKGLKVWSWRKRIDHILAGEIHVANETGEN